MAGLALFDLDDTLIDREAAFASWARAFAARHQLGDGAIAEITGFADSSLFRFFDLPPELPQRAAG